MHDQESHELGDAGGRADVVCVVLEQDRAVAGIDDDGALEHIGTRNRGEAAKGYNTRESERIKQEDLSGAEADLFWG